jgi:DNA mismatch endonuclease, patch repair protein
MRGNKGRQTELEKRMRRLLVRARLSGFRLNDRRLPGSPDFAYGAERLAVFVNGCWWHQHSTHVWPEPKTNIVYWFAKRARNAERDQRNPIELAKLGWRSTTVWECELKGQPEDCVARVELALGRGGHAIKGGSK